VISVSVCLFVCALAYLRNHTAEFHQIYHACCVWSMAVAWFSSDGVANILCTFGFVDDVMFSRNRLYGAACV